MHGNVAPQQDDELGGSTTWRPDQGKHPRTITGKLLDVRLVEGAHGAYPLVELKQDDGVVWAFHAFRDVAKSELANCAPQLGDRISITYGGRSEKGYYLYRVRHADGRQKQVNWARFSDSASLTEPPAEPDVPIDTDDMQSLPKPLPSKTVQARAEEKFGDDVPWDSE